MTIECISVGKVVVVKVAGRMEAQTIDQFQAAWKSLIQDGATHLVVDLAELQYISSAGLGSILRLAKETQGKDVLVVISGLKGLVKQVFELTGVIDLFRVYENAEAACRVYDETWPAAA